MEKIDAVLFDLGNVLAYIDFNEFWRSLGLMHHEEISPFANGYKSWTCRYETGFISTDEYLAGMQSVFKFRFNAKQIEHAFVNIIQEPIDGMIDIVKRVSLTHKTALVSNTNEIHFKVSLEKFEVLGFFQKQYLSHRMHVMKPDYGFYDAIIKDQKINPYKMLFIDDLSKNVKGAQEAGMQGLKFENPARLKESLKTMGVIF